MNGNLDKYIWPVVAALSLSLSTTGMVLSAKTINTTQTPTPISISYPEGYTDLVDFPDPPTKNVENTEKTVKKPAKKSPKKVAVKTKTASTTQKSATPKKTKKSAKIYPT